MKSINNASETFDFIVSQLKGVKNLPCKSGISRSIQGCCPAHNDREASLTVSLSDDDKILLYCHAGCDYRDIVSALGLQISDMIERKDPECLEKIVWFYAMKAKWTDGSGQDHTGYGEGVKVTAVYPYVVNGKYLYSKIRLEGGAIQGKLIRYYTIDPAKDKAEACKQEDLDHVLYKIDEFRRDRSKAKYVYIVEGEKDVETLKKIGQGFGVCTTSGGASSWKKEFAPEFKGLNVVIIRDNDKAGLNMANKVKTDLKAYAHSIRIINPSDEDHGDVTDYLTKEGGTPEKLMELIEDAAPDFASWIIDGKINPGILAKAISDNEQYIIIRNPRDDKDDFYQYVGGVYLRMNKPAIKAMIRDYIPTAKQTDNLLNNIVNLIFATASDHIHRETELNAETKYIPVENGLYNVNTRRVGKHNPGILLTSQFPFVLDSEKYDEASIRAYYKKHAPNFIKYITDLASKPEGTIDEEMILIIQEYFGFLISNEPMSKIKAVLLLWSRQGNSGKSVLIRVIVALLGLSRVASIKLKELTAENRFILGSLPDSRVIACGDESNSNVTDSSIFKAVTGGDPIKVEPKGKQGFSFVYRGGFVIACNGLPCFTDDKGDHLFDRLIILPCEHHITEEIKDPNLDEKLRTELPGIFLWALEGLHRLIKNNFVFTKSEASEHAKSEYHGMMDSVYRYVAENYDITHNYYDRISKTIFDDRYYFWATSCEGVKPVEKRNLAARMEAIGFSNGFGNVDDKRNIAVYRGLKPKDTAFVKVEKDDDMPFT